MSAVFVWKVRFMLAALGAVLAFGLPVASQSARALCGAAAHAKCAVEAGTATPKPRVVRDPIHTQHQGQYVARLNAAQVVARP